MSLIRSVRSRINSITCTNGLCRAIHHDQKSRKSVYDRFNNWAKKGRWELIFKALQLEVDDVGSSVDGSVVRAHQDASGGKRGSSAMARNFLALTQIAWAWLWLEQN